MSKAKDFQNKSAKRIVHLFEKGQQRVLLADEVGLGKTIVAKTVIKKMRAKTQQQNRELKVIYVCSNQNIIQQNAHKLGIDKDNVVPLSECRLSMQHKILFDNIDKEYLIPITPSTSLQQANNYGNANERSLIYSLINNAFEDNEKESLKWYLDTYAKNNKHTELFSDEKIKNFHEINNAYYVFIQDKLKLRQEYKDLIEKIKKELQKNAPDKRYINKLRTLFCEISMDMLQPDLVIMDEFQRYRDLMKGSIETEENRLAQKLFNAESNPKILLISATPYKPLATLEDIAQTNRNEHFEDFNELMKFLMEDNFSNFKQIWDKYSNLLGTLTNDNIEELIKIKEKAEKELRKVMVRTERYTPNLSTYIAQTVIPSSNEVDEYIKIRKILNDAAIEKNDTREQTINIDYIKSSPFLLSFMQQYVEKEYIQGAFIKKKGNKKNKLEGLLINKEDIQNNRAINYKHARFDALKNMLFSSDNSANLLWIPASMPYYYTNGIFNKLSEFSKILIFSRWGFVPRMIATLISYEASRKFRKTSSNTELSNNSNAGSALYKYKELLMSPFPKIAELFPRPEKCVDLKDVRKEISKKVIDKFKFYKITKKESKRRNYNNLLNTLKLLNEEANIECNQLFYNNDTIREITNIILASPGICMWRCFKNDYCNSYNDIQNSSLYKFTNDFVNMLSDEESQNIIKLNTNEGTVYDRTIEYCMIGNLQAVIDEYAYVLGYNKNLSSKDKDFIWKTMEESIITHSPLDIDTNESFCISCGKKTSMQRWFASDYAKITNDEKQELRKKSIQSAFNSPFRPFVLASTSVGQEGLDFHLYCRKIVHWNIPSNPINLEQRSGRINRYEGLAIRRSVAHIFKHKLNWEELFKEAAKQWQKKYPEYSEMIPHWCIPKELIGNKEVEKIENIFLLYPMSCDQEVYQRLIKQLDLYRLTMGQPNQEFIIDLLNSLNLSEDIKEDLTFHLSPK